MKGENSMSLLKTHAEDLFELLSLTSRLMYDNETDEETKHWRKKVGEQLEKIAQWKHEYYTGRRTP